MTLEEKKLSLASEIRILEDQRDRINNELREKHAEYAELLEMEDSNYTVYQIKDEYQERAIIGNEYSNIVIADMCDKYNIDAEKITECDFLGILTKEVNPA